LIPPALTLRTGLALSLAIEEFAPALKVKIKWPNDIMIERAGGYGRKAAGILTEAKNTAGSVAVFIGIGVNAGERNFPAELQNKATSIALETGTAGDPQVLLEMTLRRLYEEFHSESCESDSENARESDWQERLDARLYLTGQRVHFIPGAAPASGDLPHAVEGILAGIGPGGELLLQGEDGIREYITGELDVYGSPLSRPVSAG
jgi:BirA family biotin operon repressor/biotin-[acetyl-CoA-carboxylase] ligase